MTILHASYEAHLNGRTIIRYTIGFHCDRCNEDVEYVYRVGHVSPDWPEWRDLAELQARKHHDEICPPRRGLYQKLLVPPLSVRRR